MARAWDRSQRGERIDSLPAWVTTVSLNLARSRFRRLVAEGKARTRLATATRLPDASPDDLLDLRRALEALPRRQREAVILRYHLDLDVAEVSAAMGAPLGTVKSLLSRGRAALASALRENDLEEVRQRDRSR